jgi:hypothetical protein
VCRKYRRNRLDFQDDSIRDKQVSAESQRYLCALVENRDADLAQQRDTSLLKLKSHARGVNRLQQPRPGLPMDFDRQPNDPLRQVSMFEH